MFSGCHFISGKQPKFLAVFQWNQHWLLCWKTQFPLTEALFLLLSEEFGHANTVVSAVIPKKKLWSNAQCYYHEKACWVPSIGSCSLCPWGCVHITQGSSMGQWGTQTREERVLKTYPVLSHTKHCSTAAAQSLLPRVQSHWAHAPALSPAQKSLRLCIPRCLQYGIPCHSTGKGDVTSTGLQRTESLLLMNNSPPVLILLYLWTSNQCGVLTVMSYLSCT